LQQRDESVWSDEDEAKIREIRRLCRRYTRSPCSSFLSGIENSVKNRVFQQPARTIATRPAREHQQETSLPNNAPPLSSKQTTGSTSQDPMTQKMNSDEKKKVETEGK